MPVKLLYAQLLGLHTSFGSQSSRDAKKGRWVGPSRYLAGVGGHAMLGAIYKDLGFDPAQSFAPVAAICTDSMALEVKIAVMTTAITPV